MADNVAITAGSGTTIATDDVSGAHIQKVKLVDGTADSSTVIPGDSNGLKVQLGAALPAGTAAIGKLAANSGVDIGDVDVLSLPGVAGTVAHDSADSGNPVKIGGKAATALPAAVAAADRADLLTDVYGRPFVRDGIQGPATSSWVEYHVPAVNTQATKSKSAGGAGVRHVCTGFTVTLSAGATAPAAIQVNVYLRDGATGTGTIIWAGTLSLTATAGDRAGITRSGLWIVGSAATAMTLEFSAAGGANTYEVVSLEGVDIAE